MKLEINIVADLYERFTPTAFDKNIGKGTIIQGHVAKIIDVKVADDGNSALVTFDIPGVDNIEGFSIPGQ